MYRGYCRRAVRCHKRHNTREDYTAVHDTESTISEPTLVMVTGTVRDAVVTRCLDQTELQRINASSAYPRHGDHTRISLTDPTIEPVSEDFNDLSDAESLVAGKIYTDTQGTQYLTLMTKFGTEGYRGTFPATYLRDPDDHSVLRPHTLDHEPSTGSPVTVMVTVRPSYPGGSPVCNLSGLVLHQAPDYTGDLDDLLATRGLTVRTDDADDPGTATPSQPVQPRSVTDILRQFKSKFN